MQRPTMQRPHPAAGRDESRPYRPAQGTTVLVTRRGLAGLGITAVGALGVAALAACGSLQRSDSQGGKPAAKVGIEWWTGWGGEPANQSFKQIEVEANEQGRTYEVRHVRVSGVANKLSEAIVAGSPPDVETGNLPYAEFWVRGFAEVLDARINKSRTIKKSEFFSQSWNFGSYKGKTYGVPAVEGFIRWGLAANEELLAKRGLDPKKLPTVWDDLLGWHKELTIVDPATKAINQLGLDPMDAMGGGAGGPDPLPWGPSWGVRFYDEAKEQFNLTHAALEEALAVIKRFYDLAGGAQAVAEFRKAYGTWTGAKSGIAVGTQAMQINGPWTPGSLEKVAPQNRYAYTWIAVPAQRKGKTLQSFGGHFANLPKGSPHPDPGFEFIEFLAGDRAQTIMFDGTGWLGARKSHLAKVEANRYRGLDFYVRSATTANEMWEAPVNPIDGFFAREWRAAVDEVRTGKVSPKSALQELQRKCTEELGQRLGRG